MKMDSLILGEVTQAWKDKYLKFSFICDGNSWVFRFQYASEVTREARKVEGDNGGSKEKEL